MCRERAGEGWSVRGRVTKGRSVTVNPPGGGGRQGGECDGSVVLGGWSRERVCWWRSGGAVHH